MKLGTEDSKAKSKVEQVEEIVRMAHCVETNFLPSQSVDKQREKETIRWLAEEATKRKALKDYVDVKKCLLATFPSRRLLFTHNIS